MPDHAAFRAMIAEAVPRDDGPRLVYADFLEEQGDPDRALFLRLQCEYVNLSCARPRCPTRKQIKDRCKTCRRRHELRNQLAKAMRPEFMTDLHPRLWREILNTVVQAGETFTNAIGSVPGVFLAGMQAMAETVTGGADATPPALPERPTPRPMETQTPISFWERLDWLRESSREMREARQRADQARELVAVIQSLRKERAEARAKA